MILLLWIPVSFAASPLPSATSTPSLANANPFVVEGQMRLMLRDPFRKPSGRGPASLRDKNEIERVAIDQLKYIAVLTDDYRSRALFSLPGGKLWAVKMGDFVGLSGGVVSAINPEYVEVRETSMNIAGEQEVVYRHIPLVAEKSGPEVKS
jgi:Tfp pilus assembly protein PilP